jgi:hypothetical protein
MRRKGERKDILTERKLGDQGSAFALPAYSRIFFLVVRCFFAGRKKRICRMRGWIRIGCVHDQAEMARMKSLPNGLDFDSPDVRFRLPPSSEAQGGTEPIVGHDIETPANCATGHAPLPLPAMISCFALDT